MNEEYFWSIILEEEWIQAGIWTIRGDRVSIVASSPSVMVSSADELVEKVDSALSSAVSDFPEDAKEPNKTVFGVPASWVEDGSIKKEHLGKIRTICSKLSLSPTGFVVISEAIAHSIKMREGSPFTGVIIGVSSGSIDVSLFRLGNEVGSVNVGRSVSVVEDVVEGLSRFQSSEPTPTRWLIYNGKSAELEDVKQELIRADWKGQEGLRLLHTPKIEIVDAEQKNEAVSAAGASEIGDIKGFEGGESQSNVSETSDVSPEDLGFVVDQNIENVGDKHGEQEHDFENPNLSAERGRKFPIPALSFLRNFHIPMPMRHKGPSIGGGGGNKLKYVLLLFPIILVAGLIYAWMYLPKAEVLVYVSPKNLEESDVVTLDESVSSPDLENKVFPATVISADLSSQKSKSVTGTKTVGDKAKGKVKIRNGTSSEVNFDAGETLTGPNNLEFVLDSAVTVDAASSPSTPGEVTADVTAADIGAEYNLAKDESLSVANYPKSEVDAVVDADLSGGSSKEITAVSETDLTSLKKTVLDDLKSQAVSKLKSDAGDAIFIADSVKVEVTDSTYSKAVGDEASEVSLDMSVTATGLTVPKEQVQSLAELLLKDQVPDGFSLKPEQTKADFQLASEVSDGVWEFDVNLSANLLPSVNTDDIRSQISGKYPKDVEGYLSTIPGYSRATVTLNPRLPGFLGVIPRVTKNISVEVVAEQ